MTKYCVGARISENNTVTGKAGDQSGKELNVHTLASSGSWTYILRPPAKVVETMVKQAYNAAKNDKIGYDQNQRTTLYTQAKAKKWDLSKITTACECDCSSLIAVLCNCAGLAVSKDMYTGNEVSALTAKGFTKLSYAESKLKRGDVIWRKGHTEIYVGTTTTYSAPAKTTGSTYTHKLVDLSHWNSSVDLKKVKAAKYHVILKVGPVNGGIDQKFLARAKECEKLGIPYGCYYYSYAKTEAAAKAEAKKAIGWLKGRKLSYPVYFDSEEQSTRATAGKCAKAFCTEIEKAGYWAGIYASESWWSSYLIKTVGDKYTKWVAKYGVDDGKAHTKPSTSRTDIWQYSSKGKVDGIGGYCDVNIVYRDLVKAITKKAAPY